ncbi:protein of unknown function [Halorubrum aquaticum]|uniref:Protein-glutamine gamma-glutamyltransferase-like C-terminal domain-containing protein n=1 Tax=Halorubrum aquaticum TaxID=387340 RepID=A0A1I2ZTT4_9EURY|nr:DUF4129 domain-containing protein [Halorubrum aquaticum]SFH41035.1 protein of unknown function [Halorubrum aquaticum]
MKRETLSTALLALLAVVALGVAAATLDSAVAVDGGGGFSGGVEGGAGPTDDPGEISPSETPGGPTMLALPPVCYPVLRQLPALLLLAGALIAIGAFAYRDTGSRFAAAVVAGTVGFPVGVIWYGLSSCRDPESVGELDLGLAGEEDGLLPAGGGGGAGLGSGSGSVSTPEAAFVAVVLIAILVSLLVLVAAAGDDEDESGRSVPAEPDPDPADPDLAAVARTAGEAADRIEGDAGDNEVYRAWREMTEALEIDRPASATPGEFATAAVEAGVDEEPVSELTDVFERVRYGGADPTDDRERRAAAALRRIEDEHGGET